MRKIKEENVPTARFLLNFLNVLETSTGTAGARWVHRPQTPAALSGNDIRTLASNTEEGHHILVPGIRRVTIFGLM